MFLPFILILASCTVNTETSQDVTTAADAFISNFENENYDAIYEDASVSMKQYVSKDVFLNITNLQKKLYGKMGSATLKNESSGSYKSSGTNVYVYSLTDGNGETLTMTAEFLNGHLLKNHIDGPKWGKESDFIKGLVEPVANSVNGRDYQKVYELLDEKYPLDQVQSLIDQIMVECDSVPNKFESTWMDNDKSGKMMIAFVYGYEGKGFLDFRFFVEEDSYPFAGFYFTPDAEVRIP